LSRRAPRLALAVLLASAAASGGAQQPRDFRLDRIGPGVGMVPTGDPSAIVAAELAFARLARTKGQWTAFRETADKDAVMFVPQVANAQHWLRKRKDPARSVSWAPGKVTVSCDGSYAVSTGEAKWPDGRTSTFITLWRQQTKGGYKWALDWESDQPASGRDQIEIEGKVAHCAARGPGQPGETAGTGGPTGASGPATGGPADGPMDRRGQDRRKPPRLEIVRIPDPPPARHEGQSQDGSLRWSWTSEADGARALTISMRTETGWTSVIDDRVPARPGTAGAP
jgi:hypothetical protein